MFSCSIMFSFLLSHVYSVLIKHYASINLFLFLSDWYDPITITKAPAMKHKKKTINGSRTLQNFVSVPLGAAVAAVFVAWARATTFTNDSCSILNSPLNYRLQPHLILFGVLLSHTSQKLTQGVSLLVAC